MSKDILSEKLIEVLDSLRETREFSEKDDFKIHDSLFINQATTRLSASIGALKRLEMGHSINVEALNKDVRETIEVLGELTSDVNGNRQNARILQGMATLAEDVLREIYEEGHNLENFSSHSQGKSHAVRASR